MTAWISRLSVLLPLCLIAFPAHAVVGWVTITITALIVLTIASGTAIWVVKRNPKADNIHLKILLFSLIFWPIVFFQALFLSIFYTYSMR